MLTKTYKARLIKVCKVLFPKYKYVKLDALHRNAIFYNCRIPIISWFTSSWKISITELIKFQIPNQLADFKYGNTRLISIVQEDLVRCDITKKNVIDYFLEEITEVKCADLYKQMKVVPKLINISESTPEEDELYSTMFEFYEQKREVKNNKSYYVSKEAVFYSALFLLVLYSILRNMHF